MKTIAARLFSSFIRSKKKGPNVKQIAMFSPVFLFSLAERLEVFLEPRNIWDATYLGSAAATTKTERRK